ncbi:aldehyde dehydrogenase (NAD+) [Georgenia soli]|uniref:Aldehyde dehydrogenase (NAD+) n=1 Tax=Georgenia soli TaxID=638953 RepID=A0A2A9F3S5_9MICO|nr:aldehyde dehydrogenase family protein [Georgenia soli]PFG45105.1 aldehyde dehydrogenase (NAD+) [Georgenia soli]
MTTRIFNSIDVDQSGNPTVERRNPADSSDLVSVTVSSTAEETRDAIGKAAEAQVAWAATEPVVRGRILMDAAELLRQRQAAYARDLTREEGKTLPEAMGEVQRAIDVLRYYGSEAWRLGGTVFTSGFANTLPYTKREPLGVVGVITPWNFPIAIPSWKIAPALVTGNAVVAKPAELTPLSMKNLADALAEAGLPEGVLNVVYGGGRTVGSAIVSDERVRAVSFTGSTAVGQQIKRELDARGARVQLELGGKNALVVLDDANVEQAAAIAAAGGLGLTGQACTASSRVICTPGIYEEFVAALVRKTNEFVPGNGLDAGVRMGPVVSETQLATDLKALQSVRDAGGEFAAGGNEADGLFLAPSVVTGLPDDHEVNVEEVFGPLVSVLMAKDLDEAIEKANSTKYGLAASICTTSISNAQQFIDKIQAGVIKVNRATTGLDLNVPFGGVKESSTNTFREQGPVAIDFYTWSKSVYLGWD